MSKFRLLKKSFSETKDTLNKVNTYAVKILSETTVFGTIF